MADNKLRPYSALEERLATAAVRGMNTLNIWLYRATGGRIGGRFPGGAPILLLTTIGRKSGRPRTAALLFLRDGENLAIVASKGGMSQHPAWYRNLAANPDVEVELGSERKKMTARVASDEAKAKLWPRLVAMYPSYDDYQARTERNIPVVILAPR